MALSSSLVVLFSLVTFSSIVSSFSIPNSNGIMTRNKRFVVYPPAEQNHYRQNPHEYPRNNPYHPNPGGPIIRPFYEEEIKIKPIKEEIIKIIEKTVPVEKEVIKEFPNVKSKKIKNQSVADTKVLPVTLDVKVNLFIKLLLKALENLMEKGILPNGLLGPPPGHHNSHHNNPIVVLPPHHEEPPTTTTKKPPTTKKRDDDRKGILGLPLNLDEDVLEAVLGSLRDAL